MKRIVALLALVAFLGLPLAAWQWPLEDAELLLTFAQNSGDHFARGIILDSEDENVTSAHPGELLFAFQEGHSPYTIPQPLGSFVVVEHDRQFRTLYAHLGSVDVDAESADVTPKTVIGRVGTSGFTTGRGVLFTIVDEELHNFVNPLLILPRQEETGKPVVGRIYLERGGERIELRSGMTIAPGESMLLAELYDRSGRGGAVRTLAPYHVAVDVNDESLIDLKMDTLEGREELRLDGKVAYSDFYVGDVLVKLGRILVSGRELSVTVRVADFAGNEASRVVNLTVGGQE